MLCNPTTKESSISSAKLCSFASTTFAPVVTTAARAEVDAIANTARAATAARTATIARKTRDATLRTRPGARSAARVRVSVAGQDESLSSHDSSASSQCRIYKFQLTCARFVDDGLHLSSFLASSRVPPPPLPSRPLLRLSTPCSSPPPSPRGTFSASRTAPGRSSCSTLPRCPCSPRSSRSSTRRRRPPRTRRTGASGLRR